MSAFTGRLIGFFRQQGYRHLLCKIKFSGYCTINSFRLKVMATEVDAERLQRMLFVKHRVHRMWRGGIAGGPVIRVTPGLYSTTADIDALVVALRPEQKLFS
jgi:selenocysteine lyase/cysteine desulfurase